MRERHARVLYVVLAINALMFIVEGMAGWLSHSTSLLADALDMLGDALVFGFSLFVLSRSPRLQASAAVVKGAILLAFGVGVLAEATYKIANSVMPNVEAMDTSVWWRFLPISPASHCFPDTAQTTLI